MEDNQGSETTCLPEEIEGAEFVQSVEKKAKRRMSLQLPEGHLRQ